MASTHTPLYNRQLLHQALYLLSHRPINLHSLHAQLIQLLQRRNRRMTLKHHPSNLPTLFMDRRESQMKVMQDSSRSMAMVRTLAKVMSCIIKLWNLAILT